MRTRELKEKKCKNCGKDIPNINVYCDNICQRECQTKNIITEWLEGKSFKRGNGNQLPQWLRNYILAESNYKCSKCGWGEMNPNTKTYPLDVDHIDGDAMNNKKDNLRVLCPNCHSLTKTYKNAGNRKSSRIHR